LGLNHSEGPVSYGEIETTEVDQFRSGGMSLTTSLGKPGVKREGKTGRKRGDTAGAKGAGGRQVSLARRPTKHI